MWFEPTILITTRQTLFSQGLIARIQFNSTISNKTLRNIKSKWVAHNIYQLYYTCCCWLLRSRLTPVSTIPIWVLAMPIDQQCYVAMLAFFLQVDCVCIGVSWVYDNFYYFCIKSPQPVLFDWSANRLKKIAKSDSSDRWFKLNTQKNWGRWILVENKGRLGFHSH